MSTYADWCNEKLSQLQNEEAKSTVLLEIRSLLCALDRIEQIKVLSSMDLQRVFEQLKKSPKAEQASAACDILVIFIERADLNQRKDVNMEFLEHALNSPFSPVMLKALLRIKKDVHNEDFLVELSKNTRIMANLIRCFANTECSILCEVDVIIRLIGRSSFGIKCLLEEDIKNLMLELCKNEFIMMRIYKTLVEICYLSERSFHAIESAGLLNCLINGVNEGDVQLRFNALELLKGLGASKHGYEYLEEKQVLEKAYANFEDKVFLKLSEPPIIKLFGTMAFRKPQDILTKYPNYLQRLVDNLESQDLTVFDISLSTIGHIAFTSDGKLAFASKGDLMANIIKTVVRRMKLLPSDKQKTALYFLYEILRVTEPSNRQVVTIAENWFHCIGDDPISFIVKYMRTPLAELRLMGLYILQTIGNILWGQEAIRNTPGLIEFLLDRKSENDKKNKEVEYQIVLMLGASPVFDKITRNRLINYVIQFHTEEVLLKAKTRK